MVIRSDPFPGDTAKGYSKDCVTHILPFASKVMLMGLPISGSDAYNSISKPDGSLNPDRSSSGVRASVDLMCSLNFLPLNLLSSAATRSVLSLHPTKKHALAKNIEAEILFTYINIELSILGIPDTIKNRC